MRGVGPVCIKIEQDVTDNDFKTSKENSSDILLNLRMEGRRG
jgi:hypothetical protein